MWAPLHQSLFLILPLFFPCSPYVVRQLHNAQIGSQWYIHTFFAPFALHYYMAALHHITQHITSRVSWYGMHMSSHVLHRGPCNFKFWHRSINFWKAIFGRFKLWTGETHIQNVQMRLPQDDFRSTIASNGRAFQVKRGKPLLRHCSWHMENNTGIHQVHRPRSSNQTSNKMLVPKKLEAKTRIQKPSNRVEAAKAVQAFSLIRLREFWIWVLLKETQPLK